VAPAHFLAAVAGLRAAGFAGANVTIPHKEAAFAVCTTVDNTARRAGAVNTMVFTSRGIEGSNTDGAGFIANLRAHGVDPAAGPALLLGAGGAARAIAAALLALGVAVRITNRSPDRAEALRTALPEVELVAWDQRGAAVADHALLVNTTAAGMHGAPPLEIGFAAASPGLVVTDIVYVPLTTPFLAAAATHGLRVVGGLGMLLHQAVPGFAAWFGVTPEVDHEVLRLIEADIPLL
jgi:shikimate dehydrogenase